MKTIENKKLKSKITLPDLDAGELKQRDVDRFMAEYAKQPAGTEYGKTVRAALTAGWLKESDPKINSENMDNADPRHIKWIAKHVDALYAEATTVPND